MKQPEFEIGQTVYFFDPEFGFEVQDAKIKSVHIYTSRVLYGTDYTDEPYKSDMLFATKAELWDAAAELCREKAEEARKKEA